MRRRIPLLGVVLVSLLVLSGCAPDESPRGRIVDGEVTFAVCAPIVATTVEVFVGPGGEDPYAFPPVWQLNGEHAFVAGDTFRLGEVLDGMSALSDQVEFNPATDDLAVVLDDDDTTNGAMASWWKAGSFREASWTNGVSGENPCNE